MCPSYPSHRPPVHPIRRLTRGTATGPGVELVQTVGTDLERLDPVRRRLDAARTG